MKASEAITGYRAHGNNRPPINQLLEFQDALNNGFRPYDLCVLADVAIDLSMVQPESADKYIDIAENSLDEVVKLAEKDSEDEKEQRRLRGNARDALLRQVELRQWRQAAKHELIDPVYESVLEAATKASRLKTGDNVGSLIEFVPVLLGTRSLGSNSGWMTRQSLLREDQARVRGRINEVSVNNNWDFGIVCSQERRDFDRPRLRYQLKTSTSSGKRAYRNSPENYALGGILYVIAAQYRINYPRQIIESCWAEFYDPQKQVKYPDILSSEYLDKLTSRLSGRFASDFQKLSVAANTTA